MYQQGCVSNLPDEQDKIKKSKKIDSKKLKIGTWNVRNLKDESKLPELLSEMSRLDIDILGISETHWKKELEESFEENQHVIIQSSRVAVVMKKYQHL